MWGARGALLPNRSWDEFLRLLPTEDLWQHSGRGGPPVCASLCLAHGISA